MFIPIHRLLCLTFWVIVWIGASSKLHGARSIWTIGEQVGQWNAAANWSANGVPGPEDQATLSGGNAVVSMARVGSLILSGQLVSGRLEVVDRAFVNNFKLSQGHLLVLEPGVPTSYDGLNPTRITDASQIVNHGIFQIYAEGPFHFENGGSFFNQTQSENDTTAQVIIQLDPVFGVLESMMQEVSGTGARFVNQGAEFIQRTPGGLHIMDMPFHNNGVVKAELGSILFRKGCIHSRGAFLTDEKNEIIFAEG